MVSLDRVTDLEAAIRRGEVARQAREHAVPGLLRRVIPIVRDESL